MSTPEGKVKDHVKRILGEFRPKLYAHWPVQNGMGSPTLDCNGAINGRAFSIECKAPGKTMTARQRQTANEMRAAGVRVFEIDGADAQLGELRMWLARWNAGDAARILIEEGVA